MSNPPLSASVAVGAAPYEVENCRGILRVFNDGSISRSDAALFAAQLTTDTQLADGGSVAWKDVLFDRLHNLHLRLYKPKAAAAGDLPVVVYIHGGGFCIGSRTWPPFHNYCLRLCAEIPAVVVAPDYRLAPESRIPAAIDDCCKALKWVQDQKAAAESWMTEAADFDRVFIAGDSAGGNIAHNLAVRLGGGGEAGMRIRGFILMAPFFGGTVRTKSEVDGPTDTFLNLVLIDRYFRLAIPEGDNTDHPMVNPFGPRSPNLKPIKLGPILVVMGSRDLLRDRAVDYTNKLQEMGKEVEYVEFPGEEHGFFTFHPDSSAANNLMLVVKRFVTKNSL